MFIALQVAVLTITTGPSFAVGTAHGNVGRCIAGAANAAAARKRVPTVARRRRERPEWESILSWCDFVFMGVAECGGSVSICSLQNGHEKFQEIFRFLW